MSSEIFQWSKLLPHVAVSSDPDDDEGDAGDDSVIAPAGGGLAGISPGLATISFFMDSCLEGQEYTAQRLLTVNCRYSLLERRLRLFPGHKVPLIVQKKNLKSSVLVTRPEFQQRTRLTMTLTRTTLYQTKRTTMSLDSSASYSRKPCLNS